MKIILALILSAVANFVFAGVATIYDDPGFVTYQSNNNFRGFYRGSLGMFSCGFLFFGKGDLFEPRGSENSIFKIATFMAIPNSGRFKYEQRDPRADIGGRLYVTANKIAITTDSTHGGCLGVAGFFDAPPGQRGVIEFSQENKMEATGIFVIGKRVLLFKNPDRRESIGSLLSASLVIALRRKGQSVQVRYVNPDLQIDDENPRKKIIGWVRSMDLVDPFPSPLK
ncbi:hypothetical protein ABLT15_25300 [Paraburkholderia tropica]|uniref:hypothetical protein n=1 Tax=Paraburkholderia tropica TaxID=92647 RepID=UPI00160AC1D2|nr:hypothetical protein [Paraburkholderia tropica]MBB2981841.1 hypothetical protein [Paraburkholderia tropica]